MTTLKNKRPRREKHQQEARARNEEYKKLSPQQKLARVEAHIAAGKGNAARQLAKLTKLVAKS